MGLLLSRFGSKHTRPGAVCPRTVSNGIRFSGSMFDMLILTVAAWAGDILTRRTTTGHAVFVADGPLSWQSKMQTIVST